jgi:hypothetical protein
VTRYWASTKKTASDLWRTVKAVGREVQSEAGVLILDDSIEEKPDTEENDIVCWHYAHAKDRMLKGSNFLPALSRSQGGNGPVGFHLVAKTAQYPDPKTQKEHRRSPVATNAVCQALIKQAVTHRIPLRLVLCEGWVVSAEPLGFIKQTQQRDFLCPLKATRKGAGSQTDKSPGRYSPVETRELETQATREISLQGVDFPLGLGKQVFTTEDGSTGMRYLVSREPSVSFAALTTTSHEGGKGRVIISRSNRRCRWRSRPRKP